MKMHKERRVCNRRPKNPPAKRQKGSFETRAAFAEVASAAVKNTPFLVRP